MHTKVHSHVQIRWSSGNVDDTTYHVCDKLWRSDLCCVCSPVIDTSKIGLKSSIAGNAGCAATALIIVCFDVNDKELLGQVYQNHGGRIRSVSITYVSKSTKIALVCVPSLFGFVYKARDGVFRGEPKQRVDVFARDVEGEGLKCWRKHVLIVTALPSRKVSFRLSCGKDEIYHVRRSCSIRFFCAVNGWRSWPRE